MEFLPGGVRGYLAVPDPSVSGPPPWPGVVVLHDITGLSADLRSISDRFAAAGYLALAPDVYSPGGGAGWSVSAGGVGSLWSPPHGISSPPRPTTGRCRVTRRCWPGRVRSWRAT